MIAGVVKLVDAEDSKSSGLYVHAGSIPAPGTRFKSVKVAIQRRPFFLPLAIFVVRLAFPYRLP